MGETQAIQILAGVSPMPETMTVEAVFLAAHITPSVITPY